MPGGDSIIVATVPSEAKQVRLAPAETLDLTGTSPETFAIRWSAPGYEYFGASLVSTGGPGGWFVYSSGDVPLDAHIWPHLPNGISLSDVGLADTTDRVAYVFVESLNGIEPWDWSHFVEQRALVHGFRLIGLRDAGAADSEGGPLFGSDSGVLDATVDAGIADVHPVTGVTACADPLVFADPNLDAWVRAALGLPTGPISASVAASVRKLSGGFYIARSSGVSLVGRLGPPELE